MLSCCCGIVDYVIVDYVIVFGGSKMADMDA